jgi:hypothetical protein
MEENDLKHFVTALDRARGNKTRPKPENANVMRNLLELIKQFEGEKSRRVQRRIAEDSQSRESMRNAG